MVTAMEPAVERREHVVTSYPLRMMLCPPQWSRR